MSQAAQRHKLEVHGVDSVYDLKLPINDSAVANQAWTNAVAISSIDFSDGTYWDVAPDGLVSNLAPVFAAADLPTGVTINSSTGVMSGTPSETGTFSCRVSVKYGDEAVVYTNTFTATVS